MVDSSWSCQCNARRMTEQVGEIKNMVRAEFRSLYNLKYDSAGESATQYSPLVRRQHIWVGSAAQSCGPIYAV